jgi:hypothetical protein
MDSPNTFHSRYFFPWCHSPPPHEKNSTETWQAPGRGLVGRLLFPKCIIFSEMVSLTRNHHLPVWLLVPFYCSFGTSNLNPVSFRNPLSDMYVLS